MPKIGDLKPGPLKILMWSQPGAGKTALSLTAGKVAQIIDLDMGIETAMGMERNKPDKFSADRKLADWLPCPEPAPMASAVAYKKAKDILIAVMNAINSKTYPFQVLIIDSFTLLADAAMRYVLWNSGRLVREPKGNQNITLQEWGLMISEVEQFILLLRGLPIHVIMTAHAMPVTDASGAILGHEISIPTRRLPPTIPAYFDEVWFLQVQPAAGGGTRRVIRTEASPLFIARSRAGLPDMTDVNLGLPEIFKLLGRDISWVPPQPKPDQLLEPAPGPIASPASTTTTTPTKTGSLSEPPQPATTSSPK